VTALPIGRLVAKPSSAPALAPPLLGRFVADAFKVRYVRTPAGARRYGVPIGSPIPIGRRVKPSAGGGSAAGEQSFDDHVAHVDRAVSDAVAQGRTTDRMFSSDGGVTWTPDRAAQHREILDEAWQRQFADVPSDGRALFSGGLGGAGKGTVLGALGDRYSEYGTVDPDSLKEALAARGMVPEVEGTSPMERASLIHEESSQLAARLAERALAERKNVIFDITMSSRGSVTKRLDALDAAGYDTPEAVFVDIPVETSVQRALARHRDGHERYEAGEGHGGRYVPPAVIRAQQASAGSQFQSANRENFEALKDRFARWVVYDNGVDGRPPELVASSDPPNPPAPTGG
jgi:thymidylate kinase